MTEPMTEHETNDDDQRTTLENMALAEKKIPMPLPCPKCDRTFKNAFALRMHNVRTHGKGWNTAGNFRKGKGVPVKWVTGTAQEIQRQESCFAERNGTATSNPQGAPGAS